MDRKESTYVLRFASALSEQGWNVAASHPAAGSKVWMDARTVLASLPDLPPPVLAVTYEPLGFQYDYASGYRSN